MLPKVISLFLLPLLSFVTVLHSPASAQLTETSAVPAELPTSSYVIPNSFFGMHINSTTTPWPSQPFATQRLLNSFVGWANIETSPGVYDFRWLDKWLSAAKSHNVSLVYTFADVPQFHSSARWDSTCSYTAYGLGGCHPPKDLNADGSGTDQAFRNFVTALVKHVGTRIQFWEIWNEPNQTTMWIPTDPVNHPFDQLRRMQRDAHDIIKAANPSALILTPSPVGFPNGARIWLDGYLGAGGGTDADVIAFHGYVHHWIMGSKPIAENVVTLIESIRAVVAKYGLQNKPLWITESGWGRTDVDGFTNVTLQTAFLARYILLEESQRIPHSYWYQWDNKVAGQLWKTPNTLLLPGIAYGQVHKWTAGATLTAPCTPVGTIWTCRYSRSGGYLAMAVWDTSGTFSYIVPTVFKQFRDLRGNVTKITTPVVNIGIWPILLEN
jgi:hypothetical protein